MNFIGLNRAFMKDIKEFRLDLNLNSSKNILRVKEAVDKFSNQKPMVNLNIELSKVLGISDIVILKKAKQIIYKTFNYRKKNPKFEINFNLFDSIKYFLFFFIFILFRKNINVKNEERIKIDIILDNVEKIYVVEKFQKFLSFFNSSLIITDKKLSSEKKANLKNSSYINEHFSFISNNLLKGKRLSLIKFVFNLIFTSLKYKVNLLRIYFPIFYTSLKYHKIFNIYESKFLIFDRIYHTCPMRNYFFKKYGGKKIFCLQSHLAEGTISLFSDIDTLVTFGKEKDTRKKLRLLGGKINETFCSGSMRMEHSLENLDDVDKIDDIDILIIGLNPYFWLNTSNKIPKIYYEQMKWLAEISKKYPKLKIIYKHHTTFKGDPIEKKIFEPTTIKTIIHPEKKLNSYHFLIKSKLIVSFGSTMILEALSLGKHCYFLDPNLENCAFFNELDYLRNIRIESFEKLEKIISELLNEKNNQSNKNVTNLINDEFCLSHDKVSERIFNYIEKINAKL